MKKIKSVLIILLTCVLSFNFLLACGDRGKTEEDIRMERLEKLLNPLEPVDITVWHYYSGNILTKFQELISDFNDTVGAEKGIKITESAKRNADDLSRAIIASKNNETGAAPLPDIVQSYTDTVYEVGAEPGVANLEKYLRAATISEFVDSYIGEGRFGENNELKILPIAKSSEAMVINEKAWNAFRAAENNTISLDDLATVEGLYSVSQKYYNRYHKAFFGRDSFANYMIVGLKQLGHDIFSESEDRIAVCEHEAAYKKLWDYMYKPVIEGLYVCGSGFRTDEMLNEIIIAYIGSTASAGYIPAEVKKARGELVTGAEGYDNDVIILPLPVFEGGEKVNIQQGAGMSVICSNEKREFASAVFLEWFTSDERNLQFATATGYSPVKKAVSDFDAMSRSEAYNSPNTKVNVKNMLKVSCEMIEDYTYYYTKGFINGATIRNNLLSAKDLSETAAYKQSMEYKCVWDLKKLAEGSVTKDELLSNGNFSQWYQGFISAVSAKANEQ